MCSVEVLDALVNDLRGLSCEPSVFGGWGRVCLGSCGDLGGEVLHAGGDVLRHVGIGGNISGMVSTRCRVVFGGGHKGFTF